MLYLMRKVGQSIIINNNIEVQVIEVKGKNVKLGFTFPPDSSVLRKEIHDNVKEQNLQAFKLDDDSDLLSILGIRNDKTPEEPPENQQQ